MKMPNYQFHLSKLEVFLKEFFWEIRYEKGNFKSGTCILKTSKTIVINKFIPIEQKISALITIISELDPKYLALNPSQKKKIKELKNWRIKP